MRQCAAWTQAPIFRLPAPWANLPLLATVAFGISETRASFTDQPSLAHRARERIRRAVDRLMKRPQTVTVGTVAGHGRGPGSPEVSLAPPRLRALSDRRRPEALRSLPHGEVAGWRTKTRSR